MGYELNISLHYYFFNMIYRVNSNKTIDFLLFFDKICLGGDNMNALINEIFSSIIIAVFLFIAWVPFDRDQDLNHKIITKGLKLVLRVLQVYFLILLVVLFIQFNYFMFEGHIGSTADGLLAFQYFEVVEYYALLSLGYGIIFAAINIILFEFLCKIAADIENGIKFDGTLVKRIRIITTLVIVRFLLMTSLNALINNTFTIPLDSLVMIGMLVVLIHMFLRAKAVQFDSDMAI